jgi:myosin-5
LLSRSVKPFVGEIFPQSNSLESQTSTPRRGKPDGRKTILMRFKTSVNELVGELCEKENRDVHFIKCIRPNTELRADLVQPKVIEKQLYACGIVDIIRIAGNGFSIRYNK